MASVARGALANTLPVDFRFCRRLGFGDAIRLCCELLSRIFHGSVRLADGVQGTTAESQSGESPDGNSSAQADQIQEESDPLQEESDDEQARQEEANCQSRIAVGRPEAPVVDGEGFAVYNRHREIGGWLFDQQ